MKFSIWYNNDIKWFLDLIMKFKDNISSVYFSPPKNIALTLREETQDEKNHEKDIIKLIKTCNYYDIKSILLFNATSEWIKTWSIKNMLQKISYIKKMQKLWLTSISIYNMLHVPFIKKAIPDIEIYSSVNCEVKELEMARYMKNLWVDVITIPEWKNRDFKFINDLKSKLWIKVQVMLNEWCIRNCPFRAVHCDISSFTWEFDETGKNFNPDGLIPTHHCVAIFKKNKRHIFRSCFIRPEDIWFYEDKVDYFKIVTRDFDSKKIKIILNAYINKKFSWNLFDIVDFPIAPDWLSISYIDNDKLTELNFFENIQKCPWDCDTCNNCDKYFSEKIYKFR